MTAEKLRSDNKNMYFVQWCRKIFKQGFPFAANSRKQSYLSVFAESNENFFFGFCENFILKAMIKTRKPCLETQTEVKTYIEIRGSIILLRLHFWFSHYLSYMCFLFFILKNNFLHPFNIPKYQPRTHLPACKLTLKCDHEHINKKRNG
jgi:hypothetical protein